MALPLPSTVKDPATQQCLDAIALQFPIQAANVGKPPWTTPAFLNSWENFEAAGTHATAAYRKGAEGKVTLRGLVKRAGVFNPSSVIFTLPAGYRPSKELVFAQWGSFNAAANALAVRLDVSASGEVIVFANVTTTDFLSLNLSFYPD